MIKSVVKPTDRGSAIYEEGAFVGEYPTRRAAMNALAKKRQKLKASGPAQRDQVRTQRLNRRSRRHHRLHRFRLPHLLIDVAGPVSAGFGERWWLRTWNSYSRCRSPS